MSSTTFARRAGSVAIMIALLAAAMLVYSMHERDYDKAYAPLMKHGSVSAPVNAGPFSVRVDKVTVAKSVVEGAYGNVVKPLRTSPDAIFVIVEGREMATNDGMKLTNVVLRGTDDAQYGLSGKGTSDKFTDSIAQPGYWIAGAWLFEVPRDALAGLHLQVGNQTENDVPRESFPHLGFEFNPGADVDLGIDGDKADSLISSAREKAGYREPQK